MHRFTEYHPELLKLIQFGSKEHQKVENTLLNLADYDGLRALLKILSPTLDFMHNSIEHLDLKAIAITLETITNPSKVEDNIKTLIAKLKEKLFDNHSFDFPAEIEKFMLSTNERRLRAKKILTIILKSLPAIKALQEASTEQLNRRIELEEALAQFNGNGSVAAITNRYPAYLALAAAQEKLDSSQRKALNLLDSNLWNFVAKFFTSEELLSLVPTPELIPLIKRSQYEEFNEPALLSINAGAIHSASNIILSRTYSSTILKNDLEQTYQNLLCSNNQMIRAFMNILAINIADGDDVRILFSANINGSHYHLENNVIAISMKEQNIYKYCTIPSIFIHEVGHYAIQKLYNSNAMPIPVYSIMKQYINEHSALLLDPYRLVNALLPGLDFIKSVVLNSRILNYEHAAQQPVLYAARLLGIEETKFALYNFTPEFVKYFIDNSSIGVFLQKHEDDFPKEETNFTSCFHVSAAIMRAYLDDLYPHECPSTAPLSQDFNITKKYVMERVLPKIIEQRNLTESQVFYLQRIADFTYRVECKGDEGKGDEMYSELVVRGPELYAGGVDASEMQPFNELTQHWDQYIQPDVQTLLDSHIERCASLLETTTGYYHCNDTQCNGTLQGAVPLYCIGELVSPPLKDCH